MSKVKVGDLVRVYRRKEGGVGLVLRQEEDLAHRSGFEIDLLTLKDRSLEPKQIHNRWDAIREGIRDAADPAGAQAYVAYNHYGAKKNLKKKFVYVKWIKKPSSYHMPQVVEATQWIPTDWVKSI